MNNEIISKINKEIMDTKVNNITIKDFKNIVRELQDKDKEIRELREYVLIKVGISLLQDEKLLKTKNILPPNVRHKKDSFVISKLEENSWYTSKYIDDKFIYTVIRLKSNGIKIKGCFEESETTKGYFDDKNCEYFIVMRREKF